MWVSLFIRKDGLREVKGRKEEVEFGPHIENLITFHGSFTTVPWNSDISEKPSKALTRCAHSFLHNTCNQKGINNLAKKLRLVFSINL